MPLGTICSIGYVWEVMTMSIPVIGGAREVMFRAKDKAQAARKFRQYHKDAALERAGFVVVVFESDIEIHGSHYFRCSYAK